MAAMDPPANADATARLASILIDAHTQGRRIDAVPAGALVASEAEAYRTQAIVARRLGPIIGWKTGRKEPGAAPLRAPLFENRLYRSGDLIKRDAFSVWRLEAELMFRLGRDLPEMGTPYTRSDVVAAIEEVIVGFEIVDSRFAAWPDVAPPLLLADLLSHGAMVIGSGVPLPRTAAFEKAPVSLTIDGRVIVEREGGNPAGDILELVAWLANDLAAHGAALRAGDLVTTGSYTGMQYLPPGSRAEASFAGIGRVEIARGA
ncbi:2-keto-4-pentenoate hydratase [Methylocapsa sp. S129]|uniref:2-keto-4-pentenoate hydratase n=1 Tax=Methylocapsa sp. S129 TaxID=1641869 RepID=UPI00131BD007|nr:fumarylacetoacetate hydrolase family protein [Methylocapsa sp. S129]